MACYLRCRLTRNPVSGCYLHEHDAVAALGSSEFLEVVSDWTSSKATFPRIRALSRDLVLDQGWRLAQQTALGQLMNAYRSANN